MERKTQETAIIVTPRTYVVSKGRSKPSQSAFTCLQSADSVAVEIVKPEKSGVRVILAHLNSLTLEHPTTVALLKAAKLSTRPEDPTATATVFCVDQACGKATVNALRRETGIQKIKYGIHPVEQGCWVGVDLKTGLRESWGAAKREVSVRELAPPATAWEMLRAIGYKLRNGPLRAFRNELYGDQFPEQGALRKARGYEL